MKKLITKYFEPFMWVICAIAILGIGLSDPLVLTYITEHGPIILLWALSVVVCGAVSFLVGYVKGKAIGQATGFKMGERWGRGFW